MVFCVTSGCAKSRTSGDGVRKTSGWEFCVAACGFMSDYAEHR